MLNNKKIKLGMYDESLSVRGSSVALYDYAYYLKYTYHIDCIIIHRSRSEWNDQNTIKKFEEHFKVFSFEMTSEIDEILENENCTHFFAIKAGQKDDIMSKKLPNLVMAISGWITPDWAHGDKYFVCSEFLKKNSGIDYVPHMINLPDVKEDLRKELNIPDDAIVFGRNGGHDTFDLDFVKSAVSDVLKLKSNYYFLFQNTPKFIEHERVIHFDPNPSLEFKVKFINTCDAHLHARSYGESFGLTCGEFSSKNKPVITYSGSRERNHIMILGDKGLYYNNYQDILEIFLKFDEEDFKNTLRITDWNCYSDYYPEPVMERFVKLYDLEN